MSVSTEELVFMTVMRDLMKLELDALVSLSKLPLSNNSTCFFNCLTAIQDL